MVIPQTKTNVYKNWERRRYNLSAQERDRYREIAHQSHRAKQLAEQGELTAVHPVNTPQLDPSDLMPRLALSSYRALSLFSGGGGLDLGFERAGFQHYGSYELIPICGKTLATNRPDWRIHSGVEQGDVTQIDWQRDRHKIDVIQGGPPCQPFSVAGGQQGIADERNLWGEFIRAVNTIEPAAFVAENVPGLMSAKFKPFVQAHILDPLPNYHIQQFELNAVEFGVPQIRRRVFFIGFRSPQTAQAFQIPTPTHTWSTPSKTEQLTLDFNTSPVTVQKSLGVRAALGLPDLGYDAIAPTLRSGFTGKRNTTSILNSAASQKNWANLQVWPNGVQKNRQAASAFPAKHGHFRLSVQDCAILQGFPESWQLQGAVYQVLGQIGNSVCPPVAYQVARAVRSALDKGG